MNAQHDAQPLSLLVDGQEALVAEEVGAVRGEHGTDVTQLAHRAPQLQRGGLGILHGQERDGLQPGTLFDELLVHHRVVGAAEPHRPLAILEEAHEEAERRVEHHQLHAALVERPQPLVGVARPIVELVDEPPVPAVRRVQREGERAPAIRLVEVFRDLLVRLGHVAVGIEDGDGVAAHGLPLQRGIASGLTQWAGASPRAAARICSRARRRLARRPASLWLTLCGVRMRRSGSTPRSGFPGPSGSLTKASMAAPAIQPSASARATASSSAISPRAVLTRIAVGFIRLSSFSPMSPRVSSVSEAWSETTSDSARSAGRSTSVAPRAAAWSAET